MNDNTQELREQILDILRWPYNKAPVRLTQSEAMRQQRTDEILALIKSQTNQAVVETLDRIETDIIGIAPACTPDCDQTQHAYHQGGWDLMTKQEEKLATIRKELTQEVQTDE